MTSETTSSVAPVKDFDPYKLALERMFGEISEEIWTAVAFGIVDPPQPLPEMKTKLGLIIDYGIGTLTVKK